MSEKIFDIFEVAEANLNWTEEKQQEAQMAVKIRFGQVQATMIFSWSKKEGYLPGGKALLSQGNIP